MNFNKIAIVDYGMGNLRNVEKALQFIGAPAEITNSADKILNSSAIVLPGVGAFPDAMKNLNNTGISGLIKEEAKKGKPLLGICLGMQLLFDESEEIRITKGLGLLRGSIRKLQVNLKIPHMGWNNLIKDTPSEILKGVNEGSYVYFVHSFYADINNKGVLNAHSCYGINVPAVVSSGNVFGIQFHPEKSGEPGMQILKNFLEMVK
jgi:glutamine amidotransferase